MMLLVFLNVAFCFHQPSSFTLNLQNKKKVTLTSPKRYINNKNNIFKLIYAKMFSKKGTINVGKSWYYVHFLTDNLSYVKNINGRNKISKNTFSLFLTANDLSKISNISLIKKIEPEDKCNEDISSMITTNKFYVITSPNYNLELNNDLCIIQYMNLSNSFMIQVEKNGMNEKDFDKKKRDVLDIISKIPEVMSIHKVPEFKTNNAIISGFTQKNNVNFIQNPGLGNYYLDRYLNNHGLNGENQVITIIDTPIDFYHAMFNDDNVTFQFNTYMPNHRKIVYYGYDGNITDFQNRVLNHDYKHGTHVAGTIAGKRICENDLFNLSIFNGNAPNAKIIYAGHFNDISYKQFFNLMLQLNSSISSNSFGSNDKNDNYYSSFDYSLQLLPELTFIFAAGNSYNTFTINTPGTCKNVITVGSLDSFYQNDGNYDIISNINNTKIKYSLSPFLEHDPWTNGTIGTDPKSDIIVINITDEDKCHLFNIKQTFIIAGDYETPWFVKCLNSFNQTMDQNVKAFKDKFANINKIIDVEGNVLIKKNFKIKNGNWLNKASYSSAGPTFYGILKPDVMAPGTRIISASAQAGSNEPYGCGENINGDLTLMDGTSMATPNVGGAMALIHQFFNSGFWIDRVNLDGSTSRALIINSCKHPTGSKTPDIMVGHGIIDLSTILPVENDFGVQITHQVTENDDLINTHSVKENGHVVAKIKINSSIKKKLQITLSYFDSVIAVESAIPVNRDLDLVVVSPSKKIYYGDHLKTNDSQHCSTNEKVIIDENDVESGEYSIHVFGGDFVDSGLANSKEFHHFSIAASGPLWNGYIEFHETKECLCEKCDPNHPGYCLCDENKNIGPVCQVSIEKVDGKEGQFTTGILEVKRVKFQTKNAIESINAKSSYPSKGFTLFISPKCHLSLGEYDIIDMTFNETKTIETKFGTNEICIAIFNNNDGDTTYSIEINEAPDVVEQKKSKTKLIIGLVAGSVAFVAIIIVIVICCVKRKSFDKSETDRSKSLLNQEFINE